MLFYKLVPAKALSYTQKLALTVACSPWSKTGHIGNMDGRLWFTHVYFKEMYRVLGIKGKLLRPPSSIRFVDEWTQVPRRYQSFRVVQHGCGVHSTGPIFPGSCPVPVPGCLIKTWISFSRVLIPSSNCNCAAKELILFILNPSSEK